MPDERATVSMPSEGEAERLMVQWERRLRDLDGMQTNMQAVRGRGTALDGLVVVETAPGGTLLSIQIDPRGMRAGSEGLSEALMAAAQEATVDAARQVSEILEPVLGNDVDLGGLFDGRHPAFQMPKVAED